MTTWFDEAGHGDPVDVQAVMDSDCPSVLWDIVAAGAMVSLGTTSDGGALGVTVTLDGKWRREYVRDSEVLADFLGSALAAVLEANRAASASPVSRSRRRRS